MDNNDNQKEIKPKVKNAWLVHCAKVAKDNPDMPYKEVLKKAKDTYTKVQKPIRDKTKRKSKSPKKSESDNESE